MAFAVRSQVAIRKRPIRRALRYLRSVRNIGILSSAAVSSPSSDVKDPCVASRTTSPPSSPAMVGLLSPQVLIGNAQATAHSPHPTAIRVRQGGLPALMNSRARVSESPSPSSASCTARCGVSPVSSSISRRARARR